MTTKWYGLSMVGNGRRVDGISAESPRVAEEIAMRILRNTISDIHAATLYDYNDETNGPVVAVAQFEYVQPGGWQPLFNDDPPRRGINWKYAARAFFRRAEAKQRHLNNIESVIASVRDEERGGYFESWRDAARHWKETTKREREKSAKLEDQLLKTTDCAHVLADHYSKNLAMVEAERDEARAKASGVYVDPAYGNDCTVVPGDPSNPFATYEYARTLERERDELLATLQFESEVNADVAASERMSREKAKKLEAENAELLQNLKATEAESDRMAKDLIEMRSLYEKTYKKAREVREERDQLIADLEDMDVRCEELQASLDDALLRLAHEPSCDPEKVTEPRVACLKRESCNCVYAKWPSLHELAPCRFCQTVQPSGNPGDFAALAERVAVLERGSK